MTAAPFESLLQSIDAAAPHPWYAADYVRSSGIARDRLDEFLDQMRLSGLVAFTPWVAGKGQGYELTQHGSEVLKSPRLLAGMRRGYLPAPREVGPQEEIDPALVGTHLGRGEEIRRSILLGGRASFTKILIAANLVVFGIGILLTLQQKLPLQSALIGNNIAAIHMTGSMSGGDLMSGQWWRLLTCCFVHIGALHLVMNMYSLWVLGSFLEPLWGRYRFLIIYLTAGLGGSCFAMWHHPDSNLAGASGAIFGILGSYPAWLILNRNYLPRGFVSQRLQSLLPVILLNAFISMPGMIPGLRISWEAHLGGFIAGAAMAAMLNLHRFGRDASRWMWVGIAAMIPLVGIGALARARYSDARWVKAAREITDENQVVSENKLRHDFGKQFLKPIAAVRQAVDEVTSHADQLQSIPPKNRNAAEVAGLRQQFQNVSGGIDELSRQLENAGPYDSQFLTDTVQEVLNALRKDKVVLELSEQSLSDSNWGADDRERLQRAKNQQDEEWHKFEKRIERSE